MDLGLKGKNALVCASSKGLGKGCAKALALEGANVWLNGRDKATLLAAVDEISAVSQAEVRSIQCDITSEEGRKMALNRVPAIDILVNNAGGPPAGEFRDWGLDEWWQALNNNMLTAIELIRHVVDGMIDRKFGRVVNITSSSVRSPIPELGLSNAARNGLTGFVAGASRQVAQHNVTINNILPGRFDTDRLKSGFEHAAQESGRSADSLRAQSIMDIPAGRFGNPDEFGAVCAFLCSSHAAYITGQNILVDGGLVRLTQ